MTEPGAGSAELEVLELSESEIELLRQALRLLLATLTREEADELEQVRRLLEKLAQRSNA